MKNILVIGTRPNMEQMLTRKFKGRVNLVFYNNCAGSSEITMRARRYDHVILNTDLALHGHMYTMRKAGLAFKLTKGAAGAIAAAVEELLA